MKLPAFRRAGPVLIVTAYSIMCAIWGTTWLGIKVSLHYVAPITGAGLRFVIAGLVMYAVAAALHAIPRLREVPWKLVAVLGAFLFGLNYILTYTAETHISSGLTAVLFGVLPFFMFGLGHYLIGERTTRATWIGAVLAFAGVAVISLSASLSGSVWYALAALGAAFSSAFANVYAKRHANHDPLVTLPPAMFLAGLAVMLVGLATEKMSWAGALSLPSIGTLLYLAIAGSCIAFFINLWLLKHISAGMVGLSALIIPVIAVIVGVVLGGEVFGVREIAGAILVVAGVWVALTKSNSIPLALIE
ncbi:MAG TPA: EamA family transporter [Candidatus Baltobacteraceae bacterium]|jgi:drug/metabolite transporter (DMT)-like permease|nr:EamA family transporter [Candidatus Baltobacteraceae bacterium]